MKPPHLAWTTLSINTIVILQGALVRATGSGAGCGRDWPRCQGEILPLDHGLATWMEFSHRALSGVALIMGVWLLVKAVRLRHDLPGFLPFAIASAAFLLIEALIGAVTVLTGLTGDNVSVARGLLVAFHLLNSLFLVGALALTTVYAYPGRTWPPAWTGQTGLKILFAVGMLGMMLLMFSGGISAMGNTMFPSESLQEGLREDFSAASHPLIRLRILHPFLGIGVGVYLWVSYALTGWFKRAPQVRPFRKMLLLVYVVQLLVGTVNLAMLGPIPLQILHLALAVAAFALWSVVGWLTLSAPRAGSFAPSMPWQTKEVQPL
ncbi:MAG: COX15/CtaA family protein [Caldilineaceae bacterium]|nr:COX15/CtaA family protein [Caldilineaceae bacterium]